MDPVLLVSVGAWITLGVGLVVCFFGYRLLKLVLLMGGFGVGFSIAYILTLELGMHAGGAFAVAVIAGLVAGALFYFLHYLAVFIFGASLGLALSLPIQDGVVSIILIILGGVMALFLHRVFIILHTSFGGGLSVGMAVAWLAMDDSVRYWLLRGYNVSPRVIHESAFLWLAVGIGLGILGAITQFVTTRHAPMRIRREHMRGEMRSGDGGIAYLGRSTCASCGRTLPLGAEPNSDCPECQRV